MTIMIKSSNLARLAQLDLFQVTKNILSFLNAADLQSLMLKKVVTDMQTAFDDFDKAIIKARKTGYTDLLYQTDAARDGVLKGFVSFVKGNLHIGNADKTADAKTLLEIVNKYPYIPTLPLRDETAAITNLLQDLKQSEIFLKVNFLGAAPFIGMLEEENTKFENLYNQRTEKEALLEVEVGKKTRLALEDAFRNVANAINGLAAALGEEQYKTLSDQINREVSRAQQ